MLKQQKLEPVVKMNPLFSISREGEQPDQQVLKVGTLSNLSVHHGHQMQQQEVGCLNAIHESVFKHFFMYRFGLKWAISAEVT